MATTNDDFDGFESRIRGSAATRRISADVVAFLAVSGLFFTLLLVSANDSRKEEDGQYARQLYFESSGMNPLGYANEGCASRASTSTRSSACFIRRQSCERGDSGESRDEIFRKKISDDFPENNDFFGSTIARHLRARYSQSTQTYEEAFGKTGNPNEWLIRRTRSGRIYGKYPVL